MVDGFIFLWWLTRMWEKVKVWHILICYCLFLSRCKKFKMEINRLGSIISSRINSLLIIFLSYVLPRIRMLLWWSNKQLL